MRPHPRALLPLLLDVVAPLLVYVVLHRAVGLGDAVSLTLGGLVGAVGVAVDALSRGRVDRLGLMVLVLVALSLALVAVTGDPRVVLVKPAVVSAAAGVYCLATLRGRPLVVDTARPFVAAVGPRALDAWDTGWRTHPRVRRTVRGLTVLWGAVLVGESILRAVLVYALPLDTAVWASQLPVLAIVAAAVVTGPALRRLRTPLRDAAATVSA